VILCSATSTSGASEVILPIDRYAIIYELETMNNRPEDDYKPQQWAGSSTPATHLKISATLNPTDASLDYYVPFTINFTDNTELELVDAVGSGAVEGYPFVAGPHDIEVYVDIKDKTISNIIQGRTSNTSIDNVKYTTLYDRTLLSQNKLIIYSYEDSSKQLYAVPIHKNKNDDNLTYNYSWQKE